MDKLKRKLMMMLAVAGGQDMPITDKAEFGLITPDKDTYQLTVNHNLGRVPTLMIVFDANGVDVITAEAYGLLYCFILTTPQSSYYSLIYQVNANRSGYLSSTMTNSTYPPSFDDTQVTFSTGMYYQGKYLANHTYQYILL